MDCDTAVVDLRTVHWLLRARVTSAPKPDDCTIRAEVQLEADRRYRAITPKDIREAGICGIQWRDCTQCGAGR